MPLPNSNSHLLIQLATPKRAIEQVHATTVKEVENIPVVREFPDVFPEDLLWVCHQIGMFNSV